jgi:hypothetical protein
MLETPRMKTDPVTAARVASAESTAGTFLLPPFESASDRRDALDEAQGLILAAIEPAVRAGRDDVARKLLELLHESETA